MIVKVIDNDVDAALKECRKYFGEIKRKKIRGSYYLRPGLRIREKRKIAAIKRRFYQNNYGYHRSHHHHSSSHSTGANTNQTAAAANGNSGVSNTTTEAK